MIRLKIQFAGTNILQKRRERRPLDNRAARD